MIKKNKIIVSAASGIIILGVFLTVIFTGDKLPVKNDKTSNNTSSNSINVDIPSEASSTASTDTIKVDIGAESSSASTASSSESKKAESGASQAKTSSPKSSSNTSSGITIGNQTSSSGNSETDAFIKNLEDQGCPYCGKHDCISFYAVNEWGRLFNKSIKLKVDLNP